MYYSTNQKRDNLRKLADYLAALPLNYKAFEMRDFFEVLDVRKQRNAWYRDQISKADLDVVVREAEKIAEKYARENGGVAKCGAVACAIGHGPSVGFLLTDADFLDEYSGTLETLPNWQHYTGRVFLDVDEDGDYDQDTFDWMFGGYWSTVDNTPHGAARRIYQFLDHGVPRDFTGSLASYRTELYV